MKYNKLSKLGFAMLLAVLFGGFSWAAVHTVMQVNEENVVFDDTFSDMADENQGGYTLYTGSAAGKALSEREGWQTLEKVYQGMVCVKLGTGKADGKMVTNALSMTGDGELMVIAAGWGTGTNMMAVSVDGATLDKAYDSNLTSLDATAIKVTNGTDGQASSGYNAYYFDLKDATGNVTITISGHRLFIREVKLTSKGGEVDTRAASVVTLGEHPSTGVVGGTINLPTATVAGVDGAPVENATVTWTSSNEEVATIADGADIINLLTVGTTTIKAEFAGDNNFKGSSASFTLTVTPAPYTTIAAMLQDITATKTTVTYQFTDLLVTYVQGNNTYVSDGQDGFLFYGANLGLNAGEKITGSVTGQLYTYNGLPEMALSADNISTQVTSTGNEVAWTTIVPDALADNINVPVTIENAVFVGFGNGKNLVFKVDDKEFAVYNNWNISTEGLTDGKAYTLTGVGSVYVKGETTTYQLYLASFEATGEQPVDNRLDLTLSFPQENYEATMGEDFEEPELSGKPDGYDGMISYRSSDASVATVSYEGDVTLVAPGTVTITAEAIASQTYKEAEASYTLTVKEAETPEPVWAWADIKADFTDQSFFTENDANGATAGLKMNADGTFTRVAADDVTANAVISGKYHSNEHGISNFSATVKVEGSVKISFGTCAWGGNVTVKDETGAEVVPTFTTNTGACYHQNKKDNIVSAYYKGEATMLTIAGGSYVPYFAVEAVDPADIPNDAKVTFDIANVECEGVAPAEITAEIGSKITIPANRTLYKDGWTLTAWTDAQSNLYKAGDEVTVNEDMTLTPVFTENTLTGEITEPTVVIWDFQQKNGAPVLNYQNKTGIYVAQGIINGIAYDNKMSFDTNNGGKIANGNWQDWCQMNGGTKLTIPAYKGMTVSIESYSATTTTTIAGSTDYTTEGNVVTYTYEGSGETIDIVIGDGSYFRYVKAVYPVPTQEEAGFVDIKADFTDQSFFTEADANGATAGLKMNEDGTFTRVAADDETANAIISGKYHSNEHGISNFSATVKVEGTVKITFGTCAWGGDVTVKNAEGETVATMNTNTGACYHQNKKDNIISCFYKQDVATTLTISGGAYVPYFAVEAVSPEQIPNDVKFIFDVANSGAEGIGPEAEIVAIGKQYTLPKNFTLYKEGFTLTGWAAEGAVYAPGETITAPDAESVTFFPVFTQNEVTLADRTEAVTVKWNFRRDAGAPAVAWENKDNLVWVAQATVADKTIDVALPFSTAPGKFANGNWTDWAQLNQGTTFHVPSAKGAVISMEAYGDITTTTIDGQSDYTQGKTISYTIGGAAESVDVVIGDGSYYRYIQVVLPKVEQQQQGGSFDNVAGTINWPVGDEQQPVISEDIAGAISSASVSAGGDLTISSATYFDTEMVHYTPKNSNAGNVEGVMIEYRVKAAKGVTFQPTQIDYAAVKVGTDNATYSWSYTVDGVESTITQIDPKPNLLRNNGSNSVENGGTAKLMHTETFAGVSPCEEFTFRFYISACANNKNICIGNVTISGIVNGEAVSVNMYELATVVAPEGAGSINVYPVSDQYEEGSEVTLTATDNFGYDFVNWTNAAGEEVSTEAKFKYTVNSDETLTANFVAVETYELALTIDGTNDYMVTISPEPTMVDGKMMYEDGTAVQLNANQYEGLVTFTNWSDGETNSSKIVSMTEDIQLTAMYAQADIIAGWDFYTAGGNGRKADFYAQDNDGDALNLVNTETGETSGWLDKSWLGAGGYESFKGAAVNWRTGSGNGDVGHWHWQTKINAEAFTDINVQFQMLYNYNAYQTYNAEYSLDGENWTKFGSITMTGTKQVVQFNEQMPAEANNQAELYIRMLADKTSNVDGAASANDGNTLAMFFITGTPKLVDDGKAPELVSTVPADGATGVSASGKIVLTFDERVKTADEFVPTATLGNQTLTPAVSGKTVTFEYKGLEYGTEYTFTLPGNSIADLTNNFVEADITLNFTTMERPSIEKKLYDYVVENVEDLLAAISAAQARSDKNTRYRIFVKDGNYTIPLKENNMVAKAEGYEVPECITFINTQNLSLIGESRDGVVITNGIDPENLFNGQYGKTSKYDGIGNSDVFQISGSDYYFQDLTIESGMADATGRDLAVQDKATRTIYKNTGLRGYQDTWTSNNDNGLYYFEGGYVRGRTDYMCGKGDAFFNGVELRQIAGGYAAVPSKSIKYGFTYKDCVINGEPATVNYATGETRTAAQVDGNYTLGRPWGQGTPVALFIDTKMNVVPSAIGWNEMSGGFPKRFAEYNSMTSTGSVIDLSGRKKVFGDGHENNPVLTAEEALEAGNLHNMFGEWDPTLATEQAPTPSDVELNKTSKKLTWTNSNYALLYAIVKDGKVVDFTLEASYEVDDAEATWAVRAANEMGGLGEAAEASIATGISEIANGEQTVPESIYNLGGVRVQKAQRGLYIINGKKVVVK